MATYKEHLDRLKVQMQSDPSVDTISKMMATSFLMQWEGGDAQVDPNAVYDTAFKLRSQKAFKQMVKDPMAKKLAMQGKHLELIQLMDIKENEVRQANEAYARPKEKLKHDAEFLVDAAEALRNGSAKGRPAELEKKSPLYLEMMRQVEAAEMKTLNGTQLSSAETKALVSSVKKYIDGGTKIAGGHKKVPHFKEAMCFLKEYMPAHEFSKYCDDINKAHSTANIDSASFTRDRMTGRKMTAKEIRMQAKARLSVRFSEDACAAILAARTLSKDDPNALIDPKELEKAKTKLLQSGSAFKRAMNNEKDRQMFKELAVSQDKKASVQLGEALEKSSKMHAIGSLQWQVNRSIRTLTEGPVNLHVSADRLASIYVSHEMASRIGPDSKINAKSFNHTKDAALKDPAFRKFVQRYMHDPEFQKRINKDLKLDNSGSIIALEVHKIKNPQAQRQRPAEAQQPQAQNPQVHEPQRQPQVPGMNIA